MLVITLCELYSRTFTDLISDSESDGDVDLQRIIEESLQGAIYNTL